MTKQIPLTQGKVAVVSDHRFEHLNQWNWCATKHKNTWYAVRNMKAPFKGTVLMHREIMNAPKEMDVDHWDGNGLNNTDENLRVCTNAQNIQNSRKRSDNTSSFKGVTWSKSYEKYQAQITVEGQYFWLGYFNDPEEAARAYDAKAKELHGEFARTNF